MIAPIVQAHSIPMNGNGQAEQDPVRSGVMCGRIMKNDVLIAAEFIGNCIFQTNNKGSHKPDLNDLLKNAASFS